MYEAMRKTGADIVQCSFCRCSTQGLLKEYQKNAHAAFITQEGLFSKSEAMKLQLDGKITSVVWNKLYKRSIWDGLRFPGGRNYEDHYVRLDLLNKIDRIYVMDRILILYREWCGSISRTYTYNNMRDLALSKQRYFEFIQSHIPKYFDAGDLQKAKQHYYGILMHMQFLCACSKGPGNKEALAFLQKELDEVRKNVDLRKCTAGMRIADYFSRHLPPAVSGRMYRIYRRLSSLFP